MERTLLALAVALLFAGDGLAASGEAPRAWTLRMLPASVEYHLRTTDTTVVEAAGHTRSHATPLERTVTRRITPLPGGLLEVEQADRELGVGVGKGTLSLGSRRAPSKFRVKSNGEGMDGARLDLVLPDGPVALGARWISATAPNRRIPFELKSAYHLERAETVKGRRCLLIAEETTGEGSGGTRGAHGSYHAKARLAFDPRAGVVVRAVSDATFTVEEPADRKGPRRRQTRISSRLELVTPP